MPGLGPSTSSSDTGVFLRSFPSNFSPDPGGLAADSDGNLYEIGSSSVFVKRFEVATGPGVGGVFLEGATSLATVPFSNDLFIDFENHIELYGPSGEPFVQRFATGLSGSHGVGVGGGPSPAVYASQRQAGDVELFKPVIFPTVATRMTSNVLAKSATVEGTVDPEGRRPLNVASNTLPKRSTIRRPPIHTAPVVRRPANSPLGRAPVM